MALTEIPSELSSTPSIVDNGNATAITIDASENVTFSGTLNGISTTKSASGNRWGVLPEVESNGVMEVGRYLDFHSTDGDTSDYGARLDYNGTNIVSTNAFEMSSGIYLGGTAAANRLDQYESGTWNPTIPGCTITVQRAHYVKIGGLVHFSFTITINSSDNSSTQTSIFGVPFAGSVANTESTSMYMASNVDFPTGTIMSNIYNYSRSGTIAFYVTYDNGALASLPRSALSSSSTLWGSIVVQTDD